jgi:hypothetical protein
MEYQVVTRITTDDLSAAVLALIDEGWVPAGGIAYITDGGDGVIGQAMVRE